MAYAKKRAGSTTVLKSIEAGAAGSWSLRNDQRMIAETLAGFYVKHFIKDMKIALESAEEIGCGLRA